MKLPSIKSLLGRKEIKEHDVYDFRDHPNAVRMSADDQEKIKGILIDLVQMTQSLVKQDNATWRQAWQQAIFVLNPRRLNLLMHYRDAVVDGSLSGLMLQRKLSTIQKVFKITNTAGEEQPEKTKLFKKSWFRQFMYITLDTPYYGHSLIQLGDVIIDENGYRFKNAEVVPREHVMPEFNVIIPYQESLWQNGYDYTVAPFNNWCIPVGEKYDLGLLLKCVPECISIRHMGAFWDKFAELFGMPIRIGKTSSRDPKERSKISDMLSKMGSAAWGLFPDGTEIDIKESTRTDSWMVFDKRIERSENRLAYIILTESMTMKQGSSRSQGEVHNDQKDLVTKSDADMLAEVTNEYLIPLMIRHGFPLEKGDTFVFDDSKQYSPEELAALLTALMGEFDIDENYINKIVQIPVKKKAVQTPKPNTFFPTNFFD